VQIGIWLPNAYIIRLVNLLKRNVEDSPVACTTDVVMFYILMFQFEKGELRICIININNGKMNSMEIANIYNH
jgi:hypothetical protein